MYAVGVVESRWAGGLSEGIRRDPSFLASIPRWVVTRWVLPYESHIRLV